MDDPCRPRCAVAGFERGRPSLPTPPARASFVDVTVAPAAVPTQVAARADGRGFDTRVIEVSAIYGNVFLNTQPGDFALAGTILRKVGEYADERQSEFLGAGFQMAILT